MSSAEITPYSIEIPLLAAEARVKITSAPASRYVCVELHPAWRQGDFPGVQYRQMFTLEQAEMLRKYLLYGVRRALRRDGFEDAQAAPVPFGGEEFGWQVVVFLSQDECKHVGEKLHAAIAIAQSLVVAR